MFRRIILLITAIVLVISGSAACLAEAAEKLPENYGLIQSEGIVIPEITEETVKKYEIPDNEAMAFLRDMKCGWNLGNTFDAHPDGNNAYIPGASMEISWIGADAKTTRELFAALKEAGFNTIRIPVSWHNHINSKNNIDAKWLKRVKEVAGWALDLGMYAIVNVHHDNNTAFFYPDTAHYEQSYAYLTNVWSQIAEAFKDCDAHLILESLNEPRLVGTSYEWNFNPRAAVVKEAAAYINQLNQAFVDTVRESGGNNATRYLMVPGYCASPDSANNALFTLPQDSAENRIIVEVHAYTPYDYALNNNKPNDCNFDLQKDRSKRNAIESFMNSLYRKFISNGIPVVIDEFGALQKKAEDLQGRVNYAAFYIAAASARGMTCCWWDNHCFEGNGERFGLIDRIKIEWVYPDIALALVKNSLYNRE